MPREANFNFNFDNVFDCRLIAFGKEFLTKHEPPLSFHPQDHKLRPLSDYMQVEFNKECKVPMHSWLLRERDSVGENYEQRMKLLGNIVVPQCGLLASQILLRIYRSV